MTMPGDILPGILRYIQLELGTSRSLLNLFYLSWYGGLLELAVNDGHVEEARVDVSLF